jgi:lipopolysaccharide/colanic/teichoic acid biosynthesis glycosyltransferase
MDPAADERLKGLADSGGAAQTAAASSSPAQSDPTKPDGDGRFYAVPLSGRTPRRDSWLIEGIYRLFELTIATVGLIVGLPIMLVEGLLIRLESPGRALFFQPRIGQSNVMRGHELDGRSDLRFAAPGLTPEALYYVPTTFSFIKFRTMYADARQRFPELYNYSFGPHQFHKMNCKKEDDPRVTRIGYYLRRLTIDELPNLCCVLRGQMRLVGPRPEIAEVLRQYSPEEMYRFLVKPGITGLAQINGRGLLTWGEALVWDLEYVRTRSVRLDLTILWKTFWRVITRHGAI